MLKVKYFCFTTVAAKLKTCLLADDFWYYSKRQNHENFEEAVYKRTSKNSNREPTDFRKQSYRNCSAKALEQNTSIFTLESCPHEFLL